MVRKGAVGFKVNTARNVSAEGRKHLFGIKSAGAVACVNGKLKPRQGFIVLGGAEPITNKFAQICGIFVKESAVVNLTVARNCISRKGYVQYVGYVGTLKSAFTDKKFKSVAIIWVMRSGNRNSGVAIFQHRRHKHGGRCTKSATDNRKARIAKRRNNLTFDTLAR